MNDNKKNAKLQPRGESSKPGSQRVCTCERVQHNQPGNRGRVQHTKNICAKHSVSNPESRGIQRVYASTKKLNRKGFVGDVLTWAVVILVLVVMVFFGYNFLNAASDSTQGLPVMQAGFQSSTNNWARGWDIAVIAGLGFLILGTLTSVWLIGTNPAFFWITFILLIFFLLMVTVFHNIANEIIYEEGMMTAAEAMPGITFIATNILYISMAVAGLLIIVLFAKARTD